MKNFSVSLFVLTLLLIVFVPIVVFADEIGFSDVSKEHWAFEDIMILTQKGVLKGYEDGTFKPEKEVTREEFVTILYNMNDRGVDYSTDFINFPLKDVEKDRWSYYAITSYGNSLVDFDGEEAYYHPSMVLTREEVAKLLSILFYLEGSQYTDSQIVELNEYIESALKKFDDKELIRSDLKPYVYLATEKGMMKGVSDNLFSPKTGVTRAQAVTLIRRLEYPYERYIEKVDRPDNTNKEKNGMKLIENVDNQFQNSFKPDNIYVLSANGFNFYMSLSDNSEKFRFSVLRSNDYSKVSLRMPSLYAVKSDNNVNWANMSYMTECSSLFGFELDIKDYNSGVATLSIPTSKGTYYIESKWNGSDMDINAMKDMIQFIFNNANIIPGYSIKTLSKINIDKELNKFIKNNKNKTLYYNDAKIVTKGNELHILLNDVEKIFTINDDSLISQSEIEKLCSGIGFGMFYYNSNYCLVTEDNFCLLDGLKTSDFGNFIAYIFNNNKLSKKENHNKESSEILKFSDIIEVEPQSGFYSTTSYVVSNTFEMEFNRKIKSVDVEVTNSKGESVLLYTKVLNKRSGAIDPNKITANLDQKVLGITISHRKGETYKFTIKNFIDVDGNKTAADDIFTYEYVAKGDKEPDKGKKIEKIIFNVPNDLNDSSVIQVYFDGDIGAKQLISCYVTFEGNKGICYYRTGEFSIEYLKSVRNYTSLDFIRGDIIGLEISIIDYTSGQAETVLTDTLEIKVP